MRRRAARHEAGLRRDDGAVMVRVLLEGGKLRFEVDPENTKISDLRFDLHRPKIV